MLLEEPEPEGDGGDGGEGEEEEQAQEAELELVSVHALAQSFCAVVKSGHEPEIGWLVVQVAGVPGVQLDVTEIPK